MTSDYIVSEHLFLVNAFYRSDVKFRTETTASICLIQMRRIPSVFPKDIEDISALIVDADKDMLEKIISEIQKILCMMIEKKDMLII